MSNTTPGSAISRRSNPNANPEGSAFLLTLLQRYADQVPGRTKRELLLAHEIDAYSGGRASVEQAVQAWRALPEATRIATVGEQAASADHRALMDDDMLGRQARQAFRARGVKNPLGFSVRASTAALTPAGQPPFTLVPPDPAGPRPDVKGRTDAPSGPQEQVPDGDVDTVIGDAPATVATSRVALDRSKSGVPVTDQAVNGALYQIRYVGMYCLEESSWDGGSNSDEPYVCFNIHDAGNHSYSKRTGVYSDVDRHEKRGPKPDPRILVGPAPLPNDITMISSLVMEHDFGDPNEIRKMWHDAAKVAQCVAKYYGVDIDQAVVDAAANLLDKLFNVGDDLIGWDSVLLYPEYFDWVQTQPYNVYAGIAYDFALFHTDFDSEFLTFYILDRF